MQGFSNSECDWLSPSNTDQVRVPVTDTMKRRELLEDFLYWFFDSFVLSLLQVSKVVDSPSICSLSKTTFYVTDSAAFRKKMLYFRHDDWKTLCDPLLAALTENTFQRMD